MKKINTREEKKNFFRKISINIFKFNSAPTPSEPINLIINKEDELQSSHAQDPQILDINIINKGSMNVAQPEEININKLMVPFDSTKTRMKRNSLLFWKRPSQSQTSISEPQLEEESKESTEETMSSSDEVAANITSTEASTQNIETQQDIHEITSQDHHTEDDMAGVGVRNRNSISQYSIKIKNTTSSNTSPTTGKLAIQHPGLRYIPSNSSPLSSRPHSPQEIHYNATSNLNPTIRKRASNYSSSEHRHSLILNDSHRLSSGRLNIVPNHSYIVSEELIRILRGPSSYPEETLPRSSDRNSSYLCV